MGKTIAYTKDGMFSAREQLKCCLCGEDNRDELIVEELGISVGMGGNNYSFCKKCWSSKDLGERLLTFLGYTAIKYNDDSLELHEVVNGE